MNAALLSCYSDHVSPPSLTLSGVREVGFLHAAQTNRLSFYLFVFSGFLPLYFAFPLASDRRESDVTNKDESVTKGSFLCALSPVVTSLSSLMARNRQ